MASTDTVTRKETQFAPRRLAHANIFVSDLERSLAFYSPICGINEVFREPGIKAIFLSNGSSHHDMAIMEIDDKPRIGKGGHVQIPSGSGTVPGLNHLGFEMENERQLVEAYRRALDNGVEVSRTTDHGMSHSVYMFDLESTFLEFYADAVEDWRAFYQDKESQLISAKWDPLAQAPMEQPLYQEDFEPDFVADAPMHPRQIARATLLTADFRESLGFYRSVAGLDPLHLDEQAGIAVLAGTLGTPTLALFSCREGEAPGLHHIGFELVDDVELERLNADIRSIGASPVEVIEHAGKRGVALADPDGLVLEFYRPVTNEWSPADARSERDLYLI